MMVEFNTKLRSQVYITRKDQLKHDLRRKGLHFMTRCDSEGLEKQKLA